MEGHNIIKRTGVSAATVDEHVVIDYPTSMSFTPGWLVPKGLKFRPRPSLDIELVSIIIYVVGTKATLDSSKN